MSGSHSKHRTNQPFLAALLALLRLEQELLQTVPEQHLLHGCALLLQISLKAIQLASWHEFDPFKLPYLRRREPQASAYTKTAQGARKLPLNRHVA